MQTETLRAPFGSDFDELASSVFDAELRRSELSVEDSRIEPQGRRRGFTLVEILVVVIILGIAGAIIVPSIGSRDDLKAAAAARVIMADLIYTQNLAIINQGNRFVAFDTAAQTYSVTDSAGVVVQHPVNHVNYVQ